MPVRSILTRRSLLLPILLAAGASLAAAGCGADDGEGEARAQAAVTVVATTTQVADIARNVAGDRTAVVGLAAADADPHDHEPRPSDVEAVAESDLVLRSGGAVDLWGEGVVEGSGSDAPVVELIDSVDAIEAGRAGHDHEADAHDGDAHDHGDEDVDPHWWQDPTNAVLATREIRDRLIEVDPEGSAEYEANAAAYIAQLEDLDAAIAGCMDAIPARDRKLVTSHDAFGYFAHRYDIDVVGAAIPALTTQAQPSAGETSELVELIREEEVRAVFPEAGLGAGIQEALAAETDAELGGELWGDTLGPEGSGAETYLEATAANARTLAEGLGGGERACPELDGRGSR